MKKIKDLAPWEARELGDKTYAEWIEQNEEIFEGTLFPEMLKRINWKKYFREVPLLINLLRRK